MTKKPSDCIDERKLSMKLTCIAKNEEFLHNCLNARQIVCVANENKGILKKTLLDLEQVKNKTVISAF